MEVLTRAPAEPRVETLVQALRDPACYPHPAGPVEVKETHVSYVLLAGDFAYKLKKPVRLPFLDFSSPIARRHACQEELRLNLRTAPGLYLSVECIGGDPHAPRVGDCGTVWEHAVKMRRFPQQALYASLAQSARLEAAHVDALADALAEFHGAIAGPPPPRGLGGMAHACGPVDECFAELRHLQAGGPALDALQAWALREQQALAGRFDERRAQGFVRECHGDLHLGNVAWLEGRAVLFDCIEFSERLRWGDVMADVAFAYMDLVGHGLRAEAWRFLNRYLERTGDYGGLGLLRYYAVYRALVRAKVAAIRARQAGGPAPECERYLALAQRLSARAAPVLVLMHGLSGSGKTAVSQRLLAALGAVRLRSDVERRRLYAQAGPADRYAREAHDAVHQRLEALAHALLTQGFAVIVDAAFLDAERRRRFRDLAHQLQAGFQVVSCSAPVELLRSRVAARAAAASDASEADAAVLERQHATLLDTTAPARWQPAADSLARRFRATLE